MWSGASSWWVGGWFQVKWIYCLDDNTVSCVQNTSVAIALCAHPLPVPQFLDISAELWLWRKLSTNLLVYILSLIFNDGIDVYDSKPCFQPFSSLFTCTLFEMLWTSHRYTCTRMWTIVMEVNGNSFNLEAWYPILSPPLLSLHSQLYPFSPPASHRVTNMHTCLFTATAISILS